jgi:hypothetical protein
MLEEIPTETQHCLFVCRLDGAQLCESYDSPLQVPYPQSAQALLQSLLGPDSPLGPVAQRSLAHALGSDCLKAAYFVQDFADHPGKEVRFFDSARAPRTLWIRITFTDGQILEGEMTNELDTFIAQHFLIYPLDARSKTKCILVSRAAIAGLQVISTRP